MYELIFHTPWWLPTVIAMVGVVVFITANKRQEIKLRNVGMGIVGLAILLAVASYLVDTDIEKAEIQSRAFINSIEKQRWTDMGSLLDADVNIKAVGVKGITLSKEEMVDLAKEKIDVFGGLSAMITSLEAKPEAGHINADLTVYATLDKLGQPFPSSWRFVWRKTGGKWVLTSIEMLPNTMRSDQAIVENLPRGR